MGDFISEYQSRRAERIKQFQQEYTFYQRRCEKVAGSFKVETMRFLANLPEILREIDPNNELIDYVRRQISREERKIVEKIKEMQWLMYQKGREELGAIADGNIQSLIALSDKVKQSLTRIESLNKKTTQQLYDGLSTLEKQILFFFEAHNNYRLSQYHGSFYDEETSLKRASWPFFKIYAQKDPEKREENDKQIRETIKSLLEKGILSSNKQEADFITAYNDFIMRLRETKETLSTMAARNKESVLEILTIVGVEDQETRKRISCHSSYQDIEERVNALQSLLLSEEADMLLRSNIELFLIPKSEFCRYYTQLQETVGKCREQGLEIRITKDPHLYNSPHAISQLQEKIAKKERRDPKYNIEVATIILESLKKKKSIGESYIPRIYIRDTVYGKLSEKSAAAEFDQTLDVLIKSCAVIDYSKKGKTNEPISINPHVDEITEPALREKVRRVLEL